jgi:hypothetical protein
MLGYYFDIIFNCMSSVSAPNNLDRKRVLPNEVRIGFIGKTPEAFLEKSAIMRANYGCYRNDIRHRVSKCAGFIPFDSSLNGLHVIITKWERLNAARCFRRRSVQAERTHQQQRSCKQDRPFFIYFGSDHLFTYFTKTDDSLLAARSLNLAALVPSHLILHTYSQQRVLLRHIAVGRPFPAVT